MVSIELNDAELELLNRTLKWRLSMLLTEIHHTDTRDFREELKRQATHIELMLERLTDSAHSHEDVAVRA